MAVLILCQAASQANFDIFLMILNLYNPSFKLNGNLLRNSYTKSIVLYI